MREIIKDEKVILTNDELREFRFPNLAAEISISQYSRSTIASYMGHDKSDSTWEMIIGKLNGKDDFLASEIYGALRLFPGSFDYLFSSELYTYNNKPLAYWLNQNCRQLTVVQNDEDVLSKEEVYSLVEVAKRIMEKTKYKYGMSISDYEILRESPDIHDMFLFGFYKGMMYQESKSMNDILEKADVTEE